MKYLALICMVVTLSACGNIRTVYDEYGNVVQPEAEGGGGEKDLSEHFEAKFNAAFSEKRNEQGVPQATSNRVSSFQKELDRARRSDDQFLTKEYAGTGSNDIYSMRFSGSGDKFDVKEAYTGGVGSRIDKDLHPAFATEGKGIYAVSDSFPGSTSRFGREGDSSASSTKVYSTSDSYYSHDMESGYFESRREMTPPPRVMTRDEYYRKGIHETRMILGRDQDE